MEGVDIAIRRIVHETDPEYADRYRDLIHGRIIGYPYVLPIRGIDSSVIGQLVEIHGIIVRAGQLVPLPVRLTWACSEGHHTTASVRTYGGAIEEPLQCADKGCQSRDLEIDLAASEFVNAQTVRLQERPEELPPGHIPSSLEVRMLEDLTNTVRPGDRVRIGGIIDVEERRVRGGATEYRLRVTGHSQVVEGGADGPTEITQDDITWARRMAATDTVYDNLVNSFCPKIRGHDNIKEAALLLLASSWESDRSRGDINVLIVGDPGQGKSEVLKFAASVAPRGIYTAGRSSTAAGLTAAVVKDKNGGMSLRGGRLRARGPGPGLHRRV